MDGAFLNIDVWPEDLNKSQNLGKKGQIGSFEEDYLGEKKVYAIF